MLLAVERSVEAGREPAALDFLQRECGAGHRQALYRKGGWSSKLVARQGVDRL
jgi:hypothetical protein